MNKRISDSYVIRSLEKKDGKNFNKFINTIAQEKTFVYLQDEKIKIKQTDEYLNDQIKRIKNKKSLSLIAVINNLIIGYSSIDLEDGISDHEGVLEITIINNFRNQGVGSKLLDETIKLAIQELKELKIITLTVFDNNKTAIKLYKKHGFKKYGNLPKGIYHNNMFINKIFLYKEIIFTS